jgi:UDP-GlcNAc:undecaprenyl-phosphate GlcNAc-1-phosphate transferase
MISLTGQWDSALVGPSAGFSASIMPILVPVAVIFIPLLDLILSYARRTFRGQWWFKADKEHIHHRLLRMGHSTGRAVMIMYLWTAVIAYGVIAAGLIDGEWRWWAIGAAVLVVIVLTVIPLFRAKHEPPTIDGEPIEAEKTDSRISLGEKPVLSA